MPRGVLGRAGAASDDVHTVQGISGGTAIPVDTSGGSGAVASRVYTTTQVSPTGTAGTLIAADPARKVLMLRALPTNTSNVWVGPATVTTTTGMLLQPGETLTFDSGDVPAALMQAITSSGTQVVIVTVGV